jgi:RimJ/RimL family protein N-acetyltransferase
MTSAEAPTLSDGVVSLRHWRAADAPAVTAACGDPLIARFIPVPLPYTREHADGFIEARRAGWAGEGEKCFAVVDARTDEVLGTISRHPIEGIRVSFGYWMGPWARGRGAMTRALRLITDWTLATTDLVRLEVATDVDNDASGAVALRCGYVLEGIRRAWAVDREGRPRDYAFYVFVREPGPGG